MIIGSNINTLMQQIMAMKSPELVAKLPSIEAKPYEERVELVQRGKSNIDSVIKHWDKFSDILSARGMVKSEVKKKGKDLKQVRGKLEMALRLADPKIIPLPFRDKAESAFNVVAAWFEMNKDYMESVYAAPKLTRQDISELVLPPVETLMGHVEAEYYSELQSDGVNGSVGLTTDDLVDVLDHSGKSSVL